MHEQGAALRQDLRHGQPEKPLRFRACRDSGTEREEVAIVHTQGR